MRQTAVVVLRADDGSDDWIEFEKFDDAPPVRFSKQERAAILVALRDWQRKRVATAGHEPDVDSDSGRLEPLTAEAVDALCERIGSHP
jgi:hypothetical protein